MQLRHYLVSSGLTEIVEGTSIYKRFHNVFAREYWFDAYDLPYPKRVITDTGKTQYLFRINKGVEDLGESINQHMPEGARPIPFANMIYFGDGDTDVPSMAVMRKNGGHAVAVYPSAARARPSAWTCSRPAAAISSRRPTTATAPTSSSARACCSTACWPTSAYRRRCGVLAARRHAGSSASPFPIDAAPAVLSAYIGYWHGSSKSNAEARVLLCLARHMRLPNSWAHSNAR